MRTHREHVFTCENAKCEHKGEHKIGEAVKKIHKSLRIDAEDTKRVIALKRDGESENAAYGRVISAGLGALEDSKEAAEREGSNPAHGAREIADDASGALVEALQGHLSALTAEVETLKSQLEVKDSQIAALTRIADQSQTLHAVAEHKAIESSNSERRRWHLPWIRK